jgi:hypothetical protein
MKRIGIALGADRLLAALPGGRRLETAEIADLTKVFEDLKKTAELPVARVTVALLPPLVDLRRISLPPLQPDEHRRVIARDVARYFLGTREPQIVGSDAPFAAVAAAQLIDAIEAAVAGVGWVLDAVVPAHVAWASAVRDGSLIARLPQGIELLRVERRKIVERSRVRSVDAAGTAKEIDPFAVAAEHAGAMRAHPLELLSACRRAERRRATRRFAALLSAAAALGVLLAAGVDYWGMNRELAALHTRRAAIAPQLARTMRTRDSLTALSSVVTTLRTLDANVPSWSGFFTDLADYLPRDAHLDAFRAVGDSVAMVGVAHEAATVFQGLERMPRLTSVRADGAIRQDVSATGVVREHFGVSARWSTP